MFVVNLAISDLGMMTTQASRGGLILKFSVSALNTYRQDIFELGFLSPGFVLHIPKSFQLKL
jgi:hypothetical protein